MSSRKAEPPPPKFQVGDDVLVSIICEDPPAPGRVVEVLWVDALRMYAVITDGIPSHRNEEGRVVANEWELSTLSNSRDELDHAQMMDEAD